MLADHRNDCDAEKLNEERLLYSISSSLRNRHLFGKLGYKLFKEEKKYFALCEICNKTLKNTASKRLIAHINACKQKTRNQQICIEEEGVDQTEDLIKHRKDGTLEQFQLVRNNQTISANDTVFSNNNLQTATLTPSFPSDCFYLEKSPDIHETKEIPAKPTSYSSIYSKYSKTKTNSGRGRRDIYANLNFEFKKEGRKYSALCLFCKNVITNVAASRLKHHRDRCSINKPLPKAPPPISKSEVISELERRRQSYRLKMKSKMEEPRTCDAAILLDECSLPIEGEIKSTSTSVAKNYSIPDDLPDLQKVKEEFVAEDYQLNDANVPFPNNCQLMGKGTATPHLNLILPHAQEVKQETFGVASEHQDLYNLKFHSMDRFAIKGQIETITRIPREMPTVSNVENQHSYNLLISDLENIKEEFIAEDEPVYDIDTTDQF